MLPGADEGLLREVVGSHLIAGGQPSQEATHGFLMGSNQLFEGPLTAERHHLRDESDVRKTLHQYSFLFDVLAITSLAIPMQPTRAPTPHSSSAPMERNTRMRPTPTQLYMMPLFHIASFSLG